MRYTRLANSDIDVSVVSFGCWGIIGGYNWGPQDEADSLAALRAAYEAGVTLFDTAEAYGAGKSERLVAKALAEVRDSIVIATKAVPRNHTRAGLRAACERSLTNLETDRIDLYQLHWPSWKIPVEETLGMLKELKTEGKIRAYGLSNFGPRDLKSCLAAGAGVSSNQVAYSLLFRAVEYEILPLCVNNGISVLCYSPLMQGLLTGKFATADDVPVDRARTRHFSSARPDASHSEEGAEDETFAAIRAVAEIAEELGESPTDVSVAWLLARGGVTSVIVGGRNADHARRNARAADLVLPTEDVERLSTATDVLKAKLGPNADMWESESRIR